LRNLGDQIRGEKSRIKREKRRGITTVSKDSTKTIGVRGSFIGTGLGGAKEKVCGTLLGSKIVNPEGKKRKRLGNSSRRHSKPH